MVELAEFENAVGEDRFLVFNTKDASRAIVAVTVGSARFTASDGADKLAVPGIVGTGHLAGVASLTATVDGVTSAPTPDTRPFVLIPSWQEPRCVEGNATRFRCVLAENPVDLAAFPATIRA